jgi:hypothetical protein
VGELERTVAQLGRDLWAADPEWCCARLAEYYGTEPEAFSRDGGPTAADVLDAQLWFLLDCPLDEGDTPLWTMRSHVADRAAELLARSELRAWIVDAVDESGFLKALCPLGSGRATLAYARLGDSNPEPGSYLVARSVPGGERRWVLLGRASILEGALAARFENMLASLEAPRGEFWLVHGGVLARTARALESGRPASHMTRAA